VSQNLFQFFGKSKQNTFISEKALLMEAIEFVIKYESYLDEIQQVIKPELQPVLENLR
jgi:hypothetical protein